MSSPTCPACKAKFSHDKAKLICKKCGLPDEVRVAGPKAIARWRRKSYTYPGVTKRQRKRARQDRPARAHKNKHGRVGVVHRPPRHKFSSLANRSHR